MLDDLVLRASAAAQAGYYAGARAALSELGRKAGRGAAFEPTLRRALAVVRELPDEAVTPERRRALRAQLRAKLP